MSGAPMALTVVNKIKCKLRNTLIQPHFDYICPAWYPNLTEKKRKCGQNASHI